MKRCATFDIHLASDVMSAELEQQLKKIGFGKDDFIGGTTGAVHPCHYTYDPVSRDLFEKSWEEAIKILQTTTKEEFCGYAEAEITPPRFRAKLPWKPFDSSIAFPFGRLEYERCPLGKYKHFDIHLTAELSSIDPNLKTILEDEINFHYVDIRRPLGNTVRVYTFQPLGVKKTPKLFHLLVDYLQKAGGLEGKIKLEVTYAYARFPEDVEVCPVVTRMPPLLAS